MGLRQVFILCLIFCLNLTILWFLFNNSGSYEIQKRISLPFSIRPSKEKIILFLGYVGCPSICPKSLNKLAELQDSVSDEQLQIIFVNLIDDMVPTLAQDYAHSFHPDFQGIQLSIADRKRLIESLHAFYSQAQPTIERETGHSDLVYFLSRTPDTTQWELNYVVNPNSLDILVKTYQKHQFL